jgi:CSLREA domain-containing protein
MWQWSFRNMAIFVVTTATDVVDDNDGKLSLREAIGQANADSDADSIVFSAELGGETFVLSSELQITGDLVIDGDIDGDRKADLAISGNAASRIFSLTGSSTDVALQSLFLTGGRADGQGGAILASEIGTLSIVDTTLDSSQSGSDGGAIAAVGTDLSVANSLFVGNSSAGNGGAIFVDGGAASLMNSTVYYNDAALNGGGIATRDAALILASSTIVMNSANPSSADGTGGGGVSVESSAFTTANTVIAMNLAGYGAGYKTNNDVFGIVDKAINSVFQTAVDITSNIDSRTEVWDVGFENFGDHGGTVDTISLLASSPLINAGSNDALPTDVLDVDGDGDVTETLPIDGRGLGRILGTAVDIGAYEAQQGSAIGLAAALNALSLEDLDGNALAPGALVQQDGEEMLFVLRSVRDEGGNLRLETQATIAQANQLRAAADAASHPLDIKIVCLDGYDGKIENLSDGIEVLHFTGDDSAPSIQQRLDLETSYITDSGRTVASLPYMALHKKPDGTGIDVVASTAPTAWIGTSGIAAQTIYATGIEAALAETGPAVDLDQFTLPGTNPATGRFDEAGEIMPNFDVTDSYGQKTQLYSGDAGLSVISICATWCNPCYQFAVSGVDMVKDALGDDIAFTELIIQNKTGYTAHTSDAAEWRDMTGLSRVVTFNGDIDDVIDFATGSNPIGFPTFLVIDNQTGAIVTRISGFDIGFNLVPQLAAASQKFYSTLTREVFEGTIKDDHFTGGLGFDALSGADGNDILSGYAGKDRLYGGDGRDRLDGDSGNDMIGGGRAGDRIFGAEGDDIIRGGRGHDFMDGGTGADTLSYSSARASVAINLRHGTASGSFATGDQFINIENLRGSAFADVLTGNDGDNLIEGGAGADVLDGKLGDDTLSYMTSKAAVTVNIHSGAVSGGDAVGDQVSGFEIVFGSGLGDRLSSKGSTVDQSYLLFGAGGDDIIAGGNGFEFLSGQNGVDTLTGGRGTDLFLLSPETRNRDIITDFSARDILVLDIQEFGREFNLHDKQSDTADSFDMSLFVANADGTAESAEDRLVYETDTGLLFFDRNGNAAGGVHLIATLEGAPQLLAEQFSLG